MSTLAASSSPSVTCVQFRTEQLELSDGTPLGSGAISHVMRCRLRCSAYPSLPVVVKIVSKVQVLQQGKVQSVMNEKAALQRLGPHPYIARLYGTSQSEDELYYVLEWLPHGDLLQHIRRVHLERVRDFHRSVGDTPATSASCSADIPASSRAVRCLDLHDIQLITAQLIVALVRAFEKGVVLRDLKPENIAFDEKHRACLLDFDTVDLDGAAVVPETNHGVACPPPCGTAADVGEEKTQEEKEGREQKPNGGVDDGGGLLRRPPKAQSLSAAAASPPPRRRLTVSEIQGMRKKSASFCGTAQYVSPEMVGECKWSFSSDLWALGALVYEMAYGVHLFAGVTQFEVLQKVIQDDYVDSERLFPPIDFDEQGDFAALKDFIQQLLRIDPSKRLGVHPHTHRFDAAALRSHALFRNFAWDTVDGQLRTFRPRLFTTTGPSSTAPCAFGRGRSAFDKADERRRSGSEEENENEDAVLDDAVAAAAAAKAALDALLEASVDPSSSLAAHYHVRPFNDPSYAEYVYRATADANPFEKFLVNATKNTAAAAATAATAPLSSEVKADAGQVGDCKNDETDDVIDDVGMHYNGIHAHPDFQE